MIWSLALSTCPNVSFSRVVPLGILSRRKSSNQWSCDRGSPLTHFNTGSTFCNKVEMGTSKMQKPKIWMQFVKFNIFLTKSFSTRLSSFIFIFSAFTFLHCGVIKQNKLTHLFTITSNLIKETLKSLQNWTSQLIWSVTVSNTRTSTIYDCTWVMSYVPCMFLCPCVTWQSSWLPPFPWASHTSHPGTLQTDMSYSWNTNMSEWMFYLLLISKALRHLFASITQNTK